MTAASPSPETVGYSPYVTFGRDEWAALRDNTPLSLTEDELRQLQGLNDRLSLQEVQDVYLPLSRLLNLHVVASQQLHEASGPFLGRRTAKVPYVIGIAGSVAVGKSTTARVLQALLARWPNHPKVDLVTTDGFLYPNRVLEERGLMQRKGFPESYDIRRLLAFLGAVKSGVPEVACPVYSHLTYDILPEELQLVRAPDILLLEGINVLQVHAPGSGKRRSPQLFVSDFFDFSIYVDADETNIRDWYVERFQLLRQTAFQSPKSHFRGYGQLSETEAAEQALGIWRDINEVNLHENILPTRHRARLILTKGADHRVESVRLRKL